MLTPGILKSYFCHLLKKYVKTGNIHADCSRNTDEHRGLSRKIGVNPQTGWKLRPSIIYNYINIILGKDPYTPRNKHEENKKSQHTKLPIQVVWLTWNPGLPVSVSRPLPSAAVLQQMHCGRHRFDTQGHWRFGGVEPWPMTSGWLRHRLDIL